MGQVQFQVRVPMRADADVVWGALIDWPGHAAWVPLTSVRVEVGDGGVGTRFIARTGLGPIAFDDTMRVDHVDADSRSAAVTKLGPLLTGRAGFTVVAAGTGSAVDWWEEVQVPLLPQFLAPLVGWASSLAFRAALRRLERQLRAR